MFPLSRPTTTYRATRHHLREGVREGVGAGASAESAPAVASLGVVSDPVLSSAVISLASASSSRSVAVPRACKEDCGICTNACPAAQISIE